MFGFLALAPTPLSPPTPPAAVELVWEAPEECPTGADVESLYEALLTSEPAGTGILQAHAVVTRTQRGTWRLELTTRIGDYTDVRKFRGAKCEDLAEAAATLFAFSLEPALHEPEPPPEPTPPQRMTDPPQPEPTPAPTLQPPAPPPPAPDPQPQTSTRHHLFAMVSAGPEIGTTPSVTARIVAGAGWNWRWARLEADVAWLAPRPTPDRLGEARVQAVTGLLRGCWLPGGDTWRFPVCAGFEVGGTIARADQGTGQETISGLWGGPMLSAGALRQFERVGVFVAAEGTGAVIQRELRLANDAIYSPANGSLRVLAGLEIGFF